MTEEFINSKIQSFTNDDLKDDNAVINHLELVFSHIKACLNDMETSSKTLVQTKSEDVFTRVEEKVEVVDNLISYLCHVLECLLPPSDDNYDDNDDIDVVVKTPAKKAPAKKKEAVKKDVVKKPKTPKKKASKVDSDEGDDETAEVIEPKKPKDDKVRQRVKM